MEKGDFFNTYHTLKENFWNCKKKKLERKNTEAFFQFVFDISEITQA